MADVRDFLLTVDRDKVGASHITRGTAAKLEAKELTLIDVVQSLGEYINDEDAVMRSRAVDYLSQVIGELSPAFLTRQQIQVLCQFFCDRMRDGGAIPGLCKLQELDKFNSEMAVMTFRAMIEAFQDLQIWSQSQRLQILQLLNGLLSRHRADIRKLKDESLVGITDLVSGEKDPRNLMIIFSILKVLMVEWDIVGHAENLFDSVFCYFPIVFRPPPGDPYGITPQDLKMRLKDCIAASRYFAPYAFPQLIDKLDSTSPNTKKDVLQAIAACASSYDAATISGYSVTLWDSLKYEVLNVQEEDLAEEALLSLQAIVVRLSHSEAPTDSGSFLAAYMRTITKECNDYFEEPEHKQAKPAGQILHSLGAASLAAFSLILKATFPRLITLYSDANSIAKQRALFDIFAQLLKAGTEVLGSGSAGYISAPDNPLEPFRDRLFEMFSQSLMGTPAEEMSFRLVSLKCLLLLCNIQGVLQTNEIGMVVQYLDDIVLTEDSDGRTNLKDAAINALVDISRTNPTIIMEITLPVFMARLPDSALSTESTYKVTLEGLARLSVERNISDTLIRRLLNKLEVVLQNNGSANYVQAILWTLHYTLSKRKLVEDPNLNGHYEKIVVLVSQLVLVARSGGPLSSLNAPATIGILGRLLTLVVRALGVLGKRRAGQQVYTLFVDRPLSAVPFRNDVPEAERLTLILSTYLLAGISRDTPLPYTNDSLLRLLQWLVDRSLMEDSGPIRDSVLQQIALIINKFLDDKELYWGTEILWAPSTGLLENPKLSERSLRTVFWIAKALLLRLANTQDILHSLLNLLTNPIFGSTAARGFTLILAPDEILCKDNGAIIRLLVKQKIFNICVPAIAGAFQAAIPAVKSNYLVALSGILKYITTEVLLTEVETLLPLLLQSLDLENQDVKSATIETLIIIVQESTTAVEEHVSSLIGRLLSAAANPVANSPKVRYHALRCLRGFPGKVKESNLVPYRRAVTRGMMTILDDPRRYVRKEAVGCRTVWLNMDEPDGD